MLSDSLGGFVEVVDFACLFGLVAEELEGEKEQEKFEHCSISNLLS